MAFGLIDRALGAWVVVEVVVLAGDAVGERVIVAEAGVGGAGVVAVWVMAVGASAGPCAALAVIGTNMVTRRAAHATGRVRRCDITDSSMA